MGGCCCAATTAPASRRCSRSRFLSCSTATSRHTASSPTPTRRSGWSGTCCSAASTLNDERLGYTWLEFGRRDEDGAAFCTLGCGLKAVSGRGIAAHWFFVTDQRVGEELALVDATRVALTRGPAGGCDRRARRRAPQRA